MPSTCSIGPILRTCRNWSRKSSRVNSLRRSLRASSAACLASTVCSARSISERTSPMPSTRETMRSGIKRVQSIVFFACAHELYRRARYFADRKRRAAARVAVELGQYDARKAQPFVKFARRAHRVLSDHGVGDEQNFHGRKFPLQRPQFIPSVRHQCAAGRQCPPGSRRRRKVLPREWRRAQFPAACRCPCLASMAR